MNSIIVHMVLANYDEYNIFVTNVIVPWTKTFFFYFLYRPVTVKQKKPGKVFYVFDGEVIYLQNMYPLS